LFRFCEYRVGFSLANNGNRSSFDRGPKEQASGTSKEETSKIAKENFFLHIRPIDKHVFNSYLNKLFTNQQVFSLEKPAELFLMQQIVSREAMKLKSTEQ
ncbi:MAG: hypothetical protein GY937_09775, partial [bacterium]|nr:hypothetical protein [bacterium]